MSFETTYNYRPTRDILEDYDAALYATTTSGTTDYPGPINDPNSLFLGLDYFGFDTNPGANFIIATLEGGERNYHGLELNLRKRFSDNWQAIASYNYNRRQRQLELGFERRLPGRRPRTGSARAEPVRPSARQH